MVIYMIWEYIMLLKQIGRRFNHKTVHHYLNKDTRRLIKITGICETFYVDPMFREVRKWKLYHVG